MKKLPVFVILIVVTALIVSACSGPAPAPSGGGQAAPSGNTTPKAQAPEKPAAKPTDKPSEQPANNSGNSQATDLLELADVTEGLNSLKSYESIFTMGFKGTDNSQPKEWSWTVTEQFVKEPPAKRSTIVGFGTDASGKDSTIETIEVGGKTYSRFGEICTSSDANEAPTANTGFTPSSVIGDIKTAQLLGTDNINGVTAQHYLVDVSAMNALGAYTNSKSEVWIAQPGNFVVKYSFEATGKDTFFGGGSDTEGTVKWSYELKSANQPITIAPPEDCGGTPEDIPVMTDATDESSFGTMSTYSSPSAFDVVVEFYKKEMVTKGWAAQEGGMAADGFAQLSFTKDNRTASVMITADKDKNVTTVLVTVEAK